MLLLRRNKKQYQKCKEQARVLAHARLNYFNAHYRLRVGRIFIKNHKSRWGSCSEKGKLNFNYKILFLPSDIADYIIVHELCHLAYFNHSPKFWALVGKTVPDYRALRARLRALERKR